MEKTEWATPLLEFLGILLDGRSKTLSIPTEKKVKAISFLNYAINKKKVTIKFVQQLTGTLNFLNKAIVPGRAFTRGMYSHLSLRNKRTSAILKQYHHVNLTREFLMDCHMWLHFLNNTGSCDQKLCRPFTDFHGLYSGGEQLCFYSDASLAENRAMGVVFENYWLVAMWDKGFIKQHKPSIEFLELYALTVAILTWGDLPKLRNRKIIIFCDNESVLYMVNTSASSCPQCRKLIRILVLDSTKYNRRIVVQHVRSEANVLADALSRGQMNRFWACAPLQMSRTPDKIPPQLWPPQKIMQDDSNYINQF